MKTILDLVGKKHCMKITGFKPLPLSERKKITITQFPQLVYVAVSTNPETNISYVAQAKILSEFQNGMY